MSTLHPPAEIPLREREQAEVQAVLAAMTRSPLMARLFSYVCGKYFDGESEQLSEVKIAVEVFGRTASFDRNQDAIARVEAHRLRKKLRQFYESEGKKHPIHIELPPGSYVPVFRQMPSQEPPLEQPTSPVPVAAHPGLAGPPKKEEEQPRPARNHRVWYVAAA